MFEIILFPFLALILVANRPYFGRHGIILGLLIVLWHDSLLFWEACFDAQLQESKAK